MVTALFGCGRIEFAQVPTDDAIVDVPPDSAGAALLATAFAHWTFDDGAGMTAADATGNGHTLLLVNGPTWSAGKFGGAILADGVDDYLVSMAPLALGTTAAITVSLWANRPYTAGPNHTLIELSTDYNSSSTGFGLFPDDDDVGSCAPVGLYVGHQGNAGYTMNCYMQPTSNVWHHIAVIYDKSNPATGEVTVFYDGVQQSPIGMPYVSNNTNNFGLEPLYLFSRNGTIEHNAGALDDVAIFDRALTVSELALLQ